MPTLDDIAWPRRTERLLIRRATAGDVAARWAFRRLPEVAEWLRTAWTDEATFAGWATDPANLADQLVVQVDGTVVGDAMVQLRSPWAQTEVAEQAEDVEALLAWNLDPSVQGRGYATELAEELLVITFDELGLRRVVAELFADNRPSRRLMERIGMRLENHNLRDTLHRERGWLDGMAYALLADEWRERRAGTTPARPSLDDVSWPRRTDRLLIRRATEADAAACWHYNRHPDVTEWATADEGEAAFVARWTDPDRLPVRLVVELDDTIVGDLMLKVGDAYAQPEVAEQGKGVQAEIGWTVDPAHQGRGYATEAAVDLLAVAFDELGLRRVCAECFSDNVPSWRVMEKAGMRRELASEADALHRTRGWLGSYQYALLAEEWRARRT